MLLCRFRELMWKPVNDIYDKEVKGCSQIPLNKACGVTGTRVKLSELFSTQIKKLNSLRKYCFSHFKT